MASICLGLHVLNQLIGRRKAKSTGSICFKYLKVPHILPSTIHITQNTILMYFVQTVAVSYFNLQASSVHAYANA